MTGGEPPPREPSRGRGDAASAASEAAGAMAQLGRSLVALVLVACRGLGRGLRAGIAAFARIARRARAADLHRRPFRWATTRIATSAGTAATTRPATAEVTRRGWQGRWMPIAAACLAVFLLAAVAIVGYALATLPLEGGLKGEAGQRALVLEAQDGSTFAARGAFRGERLTYADLPPHLAQAIIAIEDRRFREHSGIDLRGIARAAWRNLSGGATREGASTITQQLARQMFLSPERVMRRKVQEALIALWLERQLSKDEILLRYLDVAYFGAGAYGVDAAARRYFGKSARELDLAESAMLAGLVRAPSQLAPTRNFGGARERASLVLQAMVETDAITSAQAEAARGREVALRSAPETPPGANYFVDTVAADMRRYGAPAGDLTVRTTLNMDLQRLAEGVVERRLDADGERRKVGQAALVAMRRDGAVLAMVGGRDYEESQFNRATQARRQPGSLIKLFVYLAAAERGLTPDTPVVDRPVRIGDWEPQNSSGRFRGTMEARAAFAQSINTVAVELSQAVGIPAVIEVAKRLGVQSDLPSVPSLALGAAEVTLLEMTRAFASVASQTGAVEPFTLESIRGAGGQTLAPRTGMAAPAGDKPAARAAMLDLLQAAANEGTGRAARVPGIPVAGKTGTTQDNRDAWFIGFTPDLVVGVWVGNDDNSPMSGVTGGELPASIWQDFVARATPLVTRAPRVAATTRPSPTAASAGDASLTTASAPLRGRAEVIDTGTLLIGGQSLRLQGVEGEGGRLARDLARFLRRREVACTPVAGEVQRCRVEDEDLSSLVLAAGGARAAGDAPQDLLEAEEAARSARLGIWRRRR